MRALSILVGVLIGGSVWAQDDYYYSDKDRDAAEIKTLFNKKAKVTGFGSFDLKISETMGTTTLWVGMNGGVTLNNVLMLGLGGYGLTTPVNFMGQIPDQQLDLTGGYGGLLVGYNLLHDRVLHMTFPILIGAGGLDATNSYTFSPDNDPRVTIPANGFRVDSSSFFVFEPGAQIELNLTSWFRFGIGGNYRFVQGINIEGVSDDDMRSWVVTSTLKFGNFR